MALRCQLSCTDQISSRKTSDLALRSPIRAIILGAVPPLRYGHLRAGDRPCDIEGVERTRCADEKTPGGWATGRSFAEALNQERMQEIP
ncbi:hypothetical protein CD351_05355 [Erythrobacter sp. KY5]|nr:hypothetical protein CD351_05355 [Erythrobacter sp. KY5]